MVDTFGPLELGEAGLAAEDPAYAWTWAGRGPASGDRRRRPGRLQQQLTRRPSGARGPSADPSPTWHSDRRVAQLVTGRR